MAVNKPRGLQDFANFQRKKEKQMKQADIDMYQFIEELPVEERKEYSEIYKAWKRLGSLGEDSNA